MGDPVLITAQEAAERFLTIKIAGGLMLSLLVFAAIWIFIAWKYSEDRRKIEAENQRERIALTKTIGKTVTNALEDDGNWKKQYLVLKAKYDVLDAHCENIEHLLESVEKGKFVPKGGSGCDSDKR